MTVEDDRAELARLQEAWMQAVEDRDMETLERIVAPEFRFMAIHLHPEPMRRDQWMDAAREGYTIVSFAFESMDIDVSGDTGVVHSRYSQVASYEHVQPLQRVPADRRVDPRGRDVARDRAPLVDPRLSPDPG